MTRAAVRERAQARRAADAAFREAFDAYMFECFAKPGFKLESEAQLAERFGVTRYKVRKAIEALNQAGVLERVKHGGSTVRSVTPEELADRADRLLSVAGLSAEEFEDAVSDLVCGLVPVIMDKVDPEKLAGLETLVETVGAARTPAERRSAVFDFLTGLAGVDGNRYTALCVSLAVRQAARREAAIAAYQFEEAAEKVELQVTQSRQKMREATERYAAAARSQAEADENLRCATLGMQEGIIPVSNVLEAQTAWLSAHSERLTARIDVLLADLYLRKALGTLK